MTNPPAPPLHASAPPPAGVLSRTRIPHASRIPATDIDGLHELEQELLGPDGPGRAEAARARLDALATRLRRALEVGVSRAHYRPQAALQAAVVSAQATLTILPVRPASPELPRPASGRGQKASGTAA